MFKLKHSKSVCLFLLWSLSVRHIAGSVWPEVLSSFVLGLASCLRVSVGVQLAFCVHSNAQYLFGGAQFYFSLLNNFSVCSVSWRVPTPMCLLLHHVSSVSVWIGQSLYLCSPKYLSVVSGWFWYVLTSAPFSVWRGPILFAYVQKVHFFSSVCQRVPTPICFLLHHVFPVSVWTGPNSVLSAHQCTTFCKCLPGGSTLVCAHHCTSFIWRT